MRWFKRVALSLTFLFCFVSLTFAQGSEPKTKGSQPKQIEEDYQGSESKGVEKGYEGSESKTGGE